MPRFHCSIYSFLGTTLAIENPYDLLNFNSICPTKLAFQNYGFTNRFNPTSDLSYGPIFISIQHRRPPYGHSAVADNNPISGLNV